jgi:5-methylcytosine-specific restriction endonuclease McrA
VKRGKPLRRKTPLRQSTTVRRVNRSGRAEPERPLSLECQAQVAVACGHWAAHRHHKLPRSAGGGDEWQNTLDVCRACHEWIHAHPADSYAAGWLVRRS